MVGCHKKRDASKRRLSRKVSVVKPQEGQPTEEVMRPTNASGSDARGKRRDGLRVQSLNGDRELLGLPGHTREASTGTRSTLFFVFAPA